MSKNIGKTRSKLAEFFFKRMLKEKDNSADNQFKLSDCKSIGFIYDEESSDFKKLLTTFQSYFKQQSSVIAFQKLGVNTINQNMIDDGIKAINFSTEDINLYGKPKSTEVLNFADYQFDLLINLSEIESWPMRFVIGMSKAKFKVGIKNDEYIKYDLSIPFGKGPEKENNFDFLIKILDLINNNVTKM